MPRLSRRRHRGVHKHAVVPSVVTHSKTFFPEGKRARRLNEVMFRKEIEEIPFRSLAEKARFILHAMHMRPGPEFKQYLENELEKVRFHLFPLIDEHQKRSFKKT